MFGFQENRIVKRYARQLPGQLLRSYGSTPRYTPAQIRAAAAKLRLPEKYICFGYAAFLSAEEYAAQATSMPIFLEYDAARARLFRFAPPPVFSQSGNATAENPYISLAGWD